MALVVNLQIPVSLRGGIVVLCSLLSGGNDSPMLPVVIGHKEE